MPSPVKAVTIQTLEYQSRDITFPEWVSLITLCLSPVIMHLVSGVSQPVYLSRNRPRWHDYITLYNPISILWRYAAITDRRIRARDWSPFDMIAANAVFWTDDGWDGSEAMVSRSIPYCVRLPPTAHMSPLSWAFVKTIVVTLQGAQVLYIVGASFTRHDGPGGPIISFSVDTVFFVVGIWSLLRLWAAYWLTDDYAFAMQPDISPPLLLLPVDSTDDNDMHHEPKMEDVSSISERHATVALVTTASRYRPSSYWPSRIFRTLFATPLFIMWLFSLFAVAGITPVGPRLFTTTSFFACFSGLVGIPLIIIIYGYYSVQVGCTSTLIPCIHSRWYKVFTGLSAIQLLIMFVISAIETRKTSCGIYVTSSADRDWTICPS